MATAAVDGELWPRRESGEALRSGKENAVEKKCGNE
jgi:hypothetical protein